MTQPLGQQHINESGVYRTLKNAEKRVLNDTIETVRETLHIIEHTFSGARFKENLKLNEHTRSFKSDTLPTSRHKEHYREGTTSKKMTAKFFLPRNQVQ